MRVYESANQENEATYITEKCSAFDCRIFTFFYPFCIMRIKLSLVTPTCEPAPCRRKAARTWRSWQRLRSMAGDSSLAGPKNLNRKLL